MKEFINLIILTSILHCSSRQTLLVNNGNKPFSQFDWKIEEGLPLPYILEKEEGEWDGFRRRMNFFRSHLWFWEKDYYEDYEFEMHGNRYYKIFACVEPEGLMQKPNYLLEIFKPYLYKVSNLNNITIVLREVMLHSTIMKAAANHCFILTGMINEVKN